jgi:hypothetical protein
VVKRSGWRVIKAHARCCFAHAVEAPTTYLQLLRAALPPGTRAKLIATGGVLSVPTYVQIRRNRIRVAIVHVSHLDSSSQMASVRLLDVSVALPDLRVADDRTACMTPRCRGV